MKLRLSIAHGTHRQTTHIIFTASTAKKWHAHAPNIMLFTSFFLCFSLWAIRPPQDIVRALEKKHCSHLEYEYEEPRQNNCLEDSTQQALINLLKTAPGDFQHNHTAKLLHAIDLFHNVPGFFSTLKKVVHQAHQDSLNHGYLYEIETALAQEKQGEEVCYFDREHLAQRPFHNHEIDIETQHYHIECKDVFWENHHLRSNPDKLKRQLSEQRALIEEENRWTDRPKKFLLCSKQPIPSEWQQWLKQQKIDYRYTTGDERELYELSPSSSISSSAPYPLSSNSSRSHDNESRSLSSSSSLSEDDSQG